MSLYNMMHGQNPQSVPLLKEIGVETIEIERFRDAGIDKIQNIIWVLARSGGVNRKFHPNHVLKNNQFYIKDYDEPSDDTYALYIFRIPEAKDFTGFKHESIPDLEKKAEQEYLRMQNGMTNEKTERFEEQFGQFLKQMGILKSE